MKQYLWEVCYLVFSKKYPEFQTRTRRDEKAFLGDQCKEIEGKNRMGKTSDLFKKIRDTLDKGQKWYGPNRSRRY